MTKRKITRREALVLGSSAAAVGIVLPANVTLASVEGRDLEGGVIHQNGDWLLRYIARQVRPAREEWQRREAAFAADAETVRSVTMSRDIDAIMVHRTSEAFIAFDMASRRIRRLEQLAAFVSPQGRQERDAVSVAAKDARLMRGSEMYQVMLALSGHVRDLERQGLRAKDHRLKRRRQEALQRDLSRAFEKKFGIPFERSWPVSA